MFCTGRFEPEVYEFLGDSRNLPGVLSALQIPAATPVRPGDSVPFLMFHPLTSAAERFPDYLGLALE